MLEALDELLDEVLEAALDEDDAPVEEDAPLLVEGPVEDVPLDPPAEALVVVCDPPTPVDAVAPVVAPVDAALVSAPVVPVAPDVDALVAVVELPPRPPSPPVGACWPLPQLAANRAAPTTLEATMGNLRDGMMDLLEPNGCFSFLVTSRALGGADRTTVSRMEITSNGPN